MQGCPGERLKTTCDGITGRSRFPVVHHLGSLRFAVTLIASRAKERV